MQKIVAPAEAGAHHVCRFRPRGEIGSSLRWSDENCQLALELFQLT
jgi:hypothetical protein